MPKKPFYFTTAIDYPNAKPHIGHAYEKIIADMISRWFNKLVEKDDYDKKDKKALIQHLVNLSKTSEEHRI